jgi:hypothetical protein
MRTIEVSKHMGHYVPGSVFKQPPFKPVFQSLGIDISADDQAVMFHKLMLSRMRDRQVICVGSTTTDSKKSLYFAAYLLEQANQKSNNLPLYVYCDDAKADEFTGMWPQIELKREDEPCAVLIACGSTMTDCQRERARDIMSRFPCVPHIVQCAGLDPITIANKLFKPCHSAFYLEDRQNVTT